MLRRAQAEHILRAAAGVTNHDRFVVVGPSAVILSAKRSIPARMMMTKEVDVCADDVDDPEALSDIIEAAIGPDSLFHNTFGYCADGVSPRNAMIPLAWRARATRHRGVEARGAVAICPDIETAGERGGGGFAALFRPRCVTPEACFPQAVAARCSRDAGLAECRPASAAPGAFRNGKIAGEPAAAGARQRSCTTSPWPSCARGARRTALGCARRWPPAWWFWRGCATTCAVGCPRGRRRRSRANPP